LNIRVQNLRKYLETSAGVLKVIDNANLTVEKGDFIAIMGASGCGKSTLLFLLGCIDTPTFGSIYLDNVDITQTDESTREKIRLYKIGFVFQNYNLLPTLTVLENIILPMQVGDTFKGQRDARALALLRVVGLEEKKDEKPSNLSGGQQQRVAIARALANKPGLLLADEPTGNLDAKTSKEIMQVFRSINETQEVTLILVTHDPKTASVANRIFYLEGGKLRGTLV
jgi:ABC-type lipoprotein export system ATPase subunit